jgi:tetratricopeptide (TPR) repeat protein
MYRENCEATVVRKEQSEDVRGLRMECLTERLGGMRALTDVFADANGEVVENAVSASNALASLDRCADVPTLKAVVRPPEDPHTLRDVETLSKRLAEVKALLTAGRWKDALVEAPIVASDAERLGYKPLIAESLALHGNVLLKANDTEAAQRVLMDAFLAAEASRHDEVRAEVAENLVYVLGYQEGRIDDGLRWAKIADAVLQRLGGHDLLRAWLLNDLGAVLQVKGDKDAAFKKWQEAVSIKERSLGRDHPDVGISEGNLAGALAELGRYQEALAHIERSLALLRRGLGSAHPDIAMQMNNRGEILNALSRYAEARAAFEQAREIWARELGSDNSSIAYALTGIGISYLREGNARMAVRPLERAFAIRNAQETEPTRKAETTFALAQALWDATHERERARTLAKDARATYARLALNGRLKQVDEWLQNRAMR